MTTGTDAPGDLESTTTSSEPPSTDEGTTSTATSTETTTGVTVTTVAADAGFYQVSLLGNDLGFQFPGFGQWAQSQNPLSIVNSGDSPFDVYISANSAPASGPGHLLRFSDSPGQNEARWLLSEQASSGSGHSVTDSVATGFGTVLPGGSLTLYSYLLMGTGLEHAGVYSWTATVYAVPAP